MYSTQNVVNVTKAAISQLTAKGFSGAPDTAANLTELDTQFIVDLGEALDVQNGEATNGSPVDVFFKALLSQIAKIEIDTRAYVAELPSLYVSNTMWGLITERIKVDLSDVLVDEMWNPDGFIPWGQAATADTLSGEQEGARIAALEFGNFKPAVSAKLYKKAHGIMAALTIAREQMSTAFQSADQYSEFVAALFLSIDNALQLKAEAYALMCVSMGIAKAKANNNEYNILAEYNAINGTNLTASNCFSNADFGRYSLKRIAEIRDYIRRYTANYNNHDTVTFAAEPQTILLKQYETAVRFNTLAVTYNDDKLSIGGDYDTVTAWQATKTADGTPYSFPAASSISLSAAAAQEAGLTGEGAGNITGVIAVIYDRWSMGINIDRRNTTSQYSATKDTTNYFYHSLVNYFVDDNYPIVSIVVRD